MAEATPVAANDSIKLPSAFRLFSPSIRALARNFWTFLGLLLIVPAYVLLCIVVVVIGGISIGDHQNSFANITGIVIGIVGAAIGIYLAVLVSAAGVLVQLVSVHDKTIGIKESLQAARPFFWRWFGLHIVLMLIFLVSFILLIVPFFFALRRYCLASYYMFEYDLRIRQTLQRSAEQSKHFSDAIWGLIGVQIVVGILPFMGQALSILYFCAPAVRFQEITDRLSADHKTSRIGAATSDNTRAGHHHTDAA